MFQEIVDIQNLRFIPVPQAIDSPEGRDATFYADAGPGKGHIKRGLSKLAGSQFNIVFHKFVRIGHEQK